MTTIGFVLLSHNNPIQLAHLVWRLRRSFVDCPIVCHHDFLRSPIRIESFPSDVVFIRPSMRTFWGHISLVQAEMLALSKLYSKSNPDWFAILSSSDYLVSSGPSITRQLALSDSDAFLDVHEVPVVSDGLAAAISSSRRGCWIETAYNRYVATRLSPEISELIEETSISQLTVDESLRDSNYNCTTPALRPFPSGIRCYAGDHWLIANRRVAERLCADGALQKTIMEYFSDCVIPDEAVFQTILGNMGDIRICGDNKRFSKWTQGEFHPAALTTDDLPEIIASGAFFARKLTFPSPLIDHFDRLYDADS